MMGSFLTRALVLALGYAYPAYECFKTVEKNKPEIEQLRFWCQYWILVAVLTVFERVGDTFVSWVPMYSEAKLAFFVYLWYPKTRGTSYVYDTFLRPYVAKHETEIDRNLLELRTRAGDIVVLYWQKAASYGQTRFVEILQYVASQSPTSRPQPVQQRRQQVRQPVSTTTPGGQPASVQQPQLPRTPRNPVKNPVHDSKQEGDPVPVSPPVQSQAPASLSQPSTGATTTPASSASSETEAMEVEVTNVSTNADSNTPQETVIEETIRFTRGKLRKARAAAAAPHITATTTTTTTTATSAGATNH